MKRNSVRLMASAGALAVVMSSVPLTAMADEQGADPTETIDAIAPIEDGSIVDISELGTGSAVELTVPDHDLTVSIPQDPAAGVTLGQEGEESVTIGLPNAANATAAAIGEEGSVFYDNNDGSSTTPIVKDTGEVQFTTVVENSAAPTRYEYPIEMPDDARLADVGDGFFAVLDAEQLPLVMIKPAWAKDSNGEDVETHYEIDGDTLIQVVEHADGSAYPIVADPAVRGRLYSSIGLVVHSLGTIVRVTPTNPWRVDASHAEYWAEYKLRVNSKYASTKFKDQLLCHVGFAPFKTPWNLDSWRPNVGWLATIAAQCNPR